MYFAASDNPSIEVREQTDRGVAEVAQQPEQEQRVRPGVAAPETSEPVKLTRRQKEILRLLAAGLSNKEIAAELGISLHTVESHLHTIYKLLKLTGRSAAMRYAIDNGLG